MDLSVDKFRKTWNNGVRRVVSLPYMTHTRFLNLLIERPYVTDQMITKTVLQNDFIYVT